MKNNKYFNIENIIKDVKLNQKFPFQSIVINSKKFDIKKKINLYNNNKFSNYWLLRDLLIKNNGSISEIKKNLYMRYGGDEIAHKILDDLELKDKLKNYKILNAGSGFGSDLIEHAYLLPNSSFIGIEYNKKYADLSCKIVHSLGLEQRIKIYCADLSNTEDLLKIRDKEGLFDGVYSNLAVLHIKNKNLVYENIYKLMKENTKFRNEDYINDSLTDIKFAEEKIGCQNLKTISEMYEIAEQVGYKNSLFEELTNSWKIFTKERAINYANLRKKKSKIKEDFLNDVSYFFSLKNGAGGVFIHTK
ncbi:methyltransferase domain-containing protein [Pigmentibacter sp. JX0631]|uniref:methyltransferase domain-containing protein n=1 Tax=Pigmentibacter sp. JX0631 TaxID=2976982 RepID=UPI002468F6E1|nr:methyltransferase domain-containing protein [Pigmentibacter sp. JX0631]WGL60592.1 methyltransferase domain-containing protein [Pigmentibacter sp. JX0631]